MRFTVPASLVPALRAAVSRLTAVARDLPILVGYTRPDGLLLRACDGRAVDLEATIRGVDWIVPSDTIAVPADSLAQVLAVVPRAQDLAVSLRGTKLRLSAGAATWDLRTGDASLVPPGAGQAQQGWTVRVVAADLARVLSIARPNVGDEARYGLNGIHCEPVLLGGTGAEGLRLVATDGSRLAFGELAVETQGQDWVGGRLGLVPPALADHILALAAAEPAARVVLALSGRWIAAEAEGGAWRVCGPAMDGEFPDYRQILDGMKFACVVRVARKALSDALRRATAISREVAIEAREDEILISATDAEAGELRETVAAAVDRPDNLPRGLRIAYLADCLRVVEAEEVTVSLGKSLDPVLVRGRGAELDGEWVVMPLRLG